MVRAVKQAAQVWVSVRSYRQFLQDKLVQNTEGTGCFCTIYSKYAGLNRLNWVFVSLISNIAVCLWLIDDTDLDSFNLNIATLERPFSAVTTKMY